MRDLYEDESEGEVKNFYYVNGTQNNYTINMGEYSSLKIFGDGKNLLDFGDEISVSAECPPELETNKAKEIFSKLRKAKILDENNMPTDLSLAQCGVLASIVSSKLGVKWPWKTFGDYWKMNKETLRSSATSGFKQEKIGVFIDKINNALC